MDRARWSRRQREPPTSGPRDCGTGLPSRAAPGFERQVDVEVVAHPERAEGNRERLETKVGVRQPKGGVRLEMVAIDRDGERRRDFTFATGKRHAHPRFIVTGIASQRHCGQAHRVLARGIEELGAQHVVARRIPVLLRNGRREHSARGGSRLLVVHHERLEWHAQLEARLRERRAERDAADDAFRGNQVIVSQFLHRTVAVNAHREVRCDDSPRLPRRCGFRRLCRGNRRLCSGRFLSPLRGSAGKQGHRGQQGPQELVHWRILQDLMPARNSSVRYGSVAQFLHWGIVVLLIVQVTLGKIADSLPVGLERLVVMARHKSFGITILGIALLRLAWRLIDRPPPPPPMPRWQEIAARLNHWALYALLFALPLSGWLMSSAANRPVSWFGLAQLPDFIAPDPGLKEVFEEVHETFVNVLFVLAGLHVAAALKHQLIDRDGLLWRMLPGRAR